MANATEWAPDADQTLVRATIELFKGTSSTSMTVASSGTFTFLTQTYLYFDESQWILLVDNANPDNWMAGQVTSYNPLTGSTVFVSKVSHGSGTISDWLVYLSGAWIDNPWNGGTVTNAVQINNTLGVTGVSTLARINSSGPITSTAGEINLNTRTDLADADATLTAAQIFGGTLYIAPTAPRILTLPTAANIIAFMTGYVVGSNFEFTIVNDSLSTITIAGNTGVIQVGKTLIQEGSVTFKVAVDSPTIVSVINTSTSVFTPRQGNIDTSTVTSSAVDITLTNLSTGLQAVTMTAEGKSVILPDATTLNVSAPTFVIKNAGYFPFAVRNSAESILTVVASGGEAALSLADNTITAGNWSVGGTKIENALITFSSTLTSSYGADAVYNMFLDMGNGQTIHFTKIATNGLAVFLVDSATNTVGSPSTITVTASTVPKAVFKTAADSFIVFYGDATNNLRASVGVIVGTSIVVGIAAATGVITDIAIENGQTMPKIAQLDTNLFLIAYATADGAGVTAVMGCQVSAVTTITFGAAANINAAATNVASSPVVFSLTTLTALVLYKLGVAAPYAGMAVVISVTNANPPVCSVGSPLAHLTSSHGTTTMCNMLSATECVVADDSNTAGAVDAAVLTVSGTTVTAGGTTALDTGTGNTLGYNSNSATRFNPHIAILSSTSFLFWCIDSANQSRVLVASAVAGAITAGAKVTGSFCVSAGSGIGNMLYIGTTEFIGLMTLTTAASTNYVVIAHKITGSDISMGKVLELKGFDGSFNFTNFISCRMSNGIYALGITSTNPLGGDFGIYFFKTDGNTIVPLGLIAEYASGLRGSTPKYLANTGNRLITLAATQAIKAPATAVQLRVTNIETVGV